jgi:serine protease
MLKQIGRRATLFAAVCAATALTLGATAGANAASPQTSPSAHKAAIVAANIHKFNKGNLSQRGHTAARPHVAAGPLLYGGGPVQHNPKVFLVFWGSQWNSDGNGVQSYLTNYFNGLGTSSDHWSTVTSQYTDNSGSGPAFNGSVLGGTWVDNGAAAPSSASQTDIANEADNGAAHFGVSGSEVNIFVVSPSGTSPDGFPNTGFCAWHSWDGNVAFTNMPYVLDAGSSCGANSVQNQLDGFSIVGGHEYAETVTDPQPSSGWVAADGEENGDLCAWQNLSALSLPTGSFAVQPTWSNAAGGCATSG